MNTGQVESWSASPGELGVLYPFAGWEMVLFVLCFAAWIAFTLWQMKNEQAHFDQEDQYLSATSLPQAIRDEAE